MEQELCIFSAIITIIWVGLIFFRNLTARSYDLASWRNVFLAGFVHFQAVSVLMEIGTGAGASSFVAQNDTYVVYALTIPLFLIVFLVSAHVGHTMSFVGKALPKLEYPRNTVTVLLFALSLLFMTIAAIALRPGNYVAGFYTTFRFGFGACATGLAAYYLLSRFRDPLAWALFGCTFVIAALASTVGSIGRRGLISVLLVGGWIWYFHILRYKKPSAMVTRLMAVGAVTILIVAVYGTFRGKQEQNMLATFKNRFSQFGSAATGGGLSRESLMQLAYTDTSLRSLFIIENYPERYPHIPGNGAGLFFGMPIPRAIWSDKPEGLGLILRSQMNELANLGPGIIGHGWAEGGWIGIVGYAIFFGVLAGALDRVIKDRAWNPFFLIAIGAALGDVFAIPRGEASIFLALCVAGFFAMWLPTGLMNLFGGSILRSLGSPLPYLGEHAAAEQAVADDRASETSVVDHDIVDPQAQLGYAEPAGAVNY